MYFDTGYVGAREGKDAVLVSFIRRMVEQEKRYDYEIASLLRISQASVGKLRKQYGIDKADGFVRRFKNKYGVNAVEKFKAIVESPDRSLSDAGRYFGFSREYARQVYKKIYGEPYTKVHEKKKEIARCRKSNAFSEKRFYALELEDRLATLGLPFYVSRKRAGYLFMINGHKAVLSISSSARCRGGTARYHEAYIPKSADRYGGHIIIFRCGSGKRCHYYIVPREAISESGRCVLPASPFSRSKHRKHLEAWHLFEEKGPCLSAGIFGVEAVQARKLQCKTA